MIVLWCVPLGVLAGVVTTVAGMGGGLMMVLVLASIDPYFALTVTAPALLVANGHRAWMYRAEIDRPMTLRFCAGALPAALAAGLVVGWLPERVIVYAMITVAVGASLKALGLPIPIPARATTPVGALTGLVAATTGGGGTVAGPFFLSQGLEARRFVATAAASATFIHMGRVLGYGIGGVSELSHLGIGLVLTGALALGNVLGHRLSVRLGHRWQGIVQRTVAVSFVGMAVFAAT